jgi:hypothetical protein
MWRLLSDQYGLPDAVDTGGLNQGRFLDVLHRLEDLLLLRLLD